LASCAASEVVEEAAVEEDVEEDGVLVVELPDAAVGLSRLAKALLRSVPESLEPAAPIPNMASTPSNWVASALSWTMSLGEAFSKAETTAGDDSTGELKLESVCSKFDTPGLIEAEAIQRTSNCHIGRRGDFL
jgi:hypothetical protein